MDDKETFQWVLEDINWIFKMIKVKGDMTKNEEVKFQIYRVEMT